MATISRRSVLEGLSGPLLAQRATAGRPNIILVITDDQRHDAFSASGVGGILSFLKTPNMDRLADESVEMMQFYACPVCSPTRSSLMTGRYNYRTGIQHTSRGGALMHTDEVTAAEMFRTAGYTTGIFGKWHLGDAYPMRPMDQGFDESLVSKSGGIGWPPDLPNSYFDSRLWQNGKPLKGEGYCTDVFTDATIRFIAKNRSRPFFAYLPSNPPHGPLVVDKKYSEPFSAPWGWSRTSRRSMAWWPTWTRTSDWITGDSVQGGDHVNQATVCRDLGAGGYDRCTPCGRAAGHAPRSVSA